MDHAHILATKNHVYPLSLCEFYGFMLAEFITAQNLMVNIVAINAFVLIYFEKHLNFGRQDWRLLTYTFGAPFVGASIAAIAGQLGPNGMEHCMYIFNLKPFYPHVINVSKLVDKYDKNSVLVILINDA